MSAPAHRSTAHTQARKHWAAVLAGPRPVYCPFCKRPVRPDRPWDLDHETPVAWGGADGPTRPAHPRCNRTHGGGIRTRHRAAPSRDW